MAVRRGSQFTAVVTVARAGEGNRLSGKRVYLQLFTPALGDFADVSTAVTGGDGRVEISATLPSTPGTYRYRARWDGDAGFKPDTSPAEKVEVV